MAFKIFSTSSSTKPFKTLMVGHLGNATDGGNLVTLICFETGFQAMTTLTTSISFTILEKQLIVHTIGPVPKITYLLTKPRTILAGNYKLGICNLLSVPRPIP